jgi:LysM repeat protein
MNTDERIEAALRSRPSDEPTYAEPLAALVPGSGVQRLRPVTRSRVRTGALAAVAMLAVLAVGVGVLAVGRSGRPAVGPAVESQGTGSVVAASKTPASVPSSGCSIVPAPTAALGCGAMPSAASSAGPTSHAGPTPAATFLVYVVMRGDYAGKIASQFNLQVWELEMANPQIADFNHIEVGWTLNIPNPGQMSRPSAAASAH